jgi:hypothetical protein
MTHTYSRIDWIIQDQSRTVIFVPATSQFAALALPSGLSHTFMSQHEEFTPGYATAVSDTSNTVIHTVKMNDDSEPRQALTKVLWRGDEALATPGSMNFVD